MKNDFRYFVLFLLLFVFYESFSQTNIQSMRFHYKDGTTFDIPIASIDSITFEERIEQPSITHYVESNEVLDRAYKMASMKWIPKKPIPKRGGGFYPSNTTVMGAPYSSVKEINTYLFQDVSYHTFMTAVHNPRSVLYTDNISQAPYHGTNCAPYYGAVCSSSVMWALGIEIPYYANQIINLPDMTMLDYQVVDSLKVCDVIWKTGHVQMIYNLEYQADTLYRITTFETAGDGSHFNNYTKSQFLNLWNTSDYVGYRYSKLKYSTEQAVFQDGGPVVYNDYLCPSKGDRAVYRTTDTVTIHIFDTNYDEVVLAKGPSMLAKDGNNGYMQQYFGLQPGVYSVFLQHEGQKTASVSFEVVETNVSCELDDGSESITIYFESSARPEYAALCDIHGNSRNHPISDLDRWRGYITVPVSTNPNLCYCKVVFKGEYGRIINVPIRVEGL